ncbi:ABC transporter ATP-binding protein [Butyrivibrio sp. MC2021]|uniref:ABC transporter ATP-binding protein n=1 Tax=Butyrivibrio sp. MC2021 TaxID=1408306 RepID=UPI001FA752EF|nr:ABC transporter ATP-binding protein [Butyrivibrio sp. MC2021]
MKMSMKMKKLSEAIAKNIRAARLIQKYEPKSFVIEVLLGLFSSVAPLLTIFLSAKLLDELAVGHDKQKIILLAVLTLSAGFLMELIKSVIQRIHNVVEARLYDAFYNALADKMITLDFADVDKQETYDLFFKIEQAANFSDWGIPRAFHSLMPLFSGIFQIIGSIVLSIGLFTHQVPSGSSFYFLNSPLFIIGLIAVMLIIAAVSSLFEAKSEGYWSRQTDDATLSNRAFTFYGYTMYDNDRAIDIRMYNQAEVGDKYWDSIDSFNTRSKFAEYAKGPMGLLASASAGVSVSLTGLAYLFVCLKAWGGAFGVGAVTQYVGAITSLFLGISGIMEKMAAFKTNADYLDICFKYLDMPNSMYRGSLTTEKRSDRKYDVEFKDVSFKYPGSDQWALRHVNMKFRVGERLAVVGMNGSGKTTFIKLLCRLYDPTEGEILLNGINIKKYRYEDYINIFSVVFQDFKLLAFPLGENVAGSRDYDKDKVMQCLADAGFELSDEKMKNGLSTYLYKELDKEGVEISGGEAQKIAIARALYKNAPFIILDEPTAALDPIAEAEIYSKFNDIAGDKTAVYISHRLSSCKFCDEIAVFHEGSVIQKGTHEALVADKSGKYYELWNAQAQYYADDAGAIA